jgi:hypothetical protein
MQAVTRVITGPCACASIAYVLAATNWSCAAPEPSAPVPAAPAAAATGPAATGPAATGPAASLRIEPWQPAAVSSDEFESHPAFDPRNGDLYFVRSSTHFAGWRILVSRCAADGGRAAPVSPPFAGDGVEADPFFTADGRSLYFISTRAQGSTAIAAFDIWRVDRDELDVWGAPVRLPEPVNSAEGDWFPRPSADGWLYFGSNRPGGVGKNDIWRARETGGAWTVENLGPAINTPGDEYEPLPSPDGARLVVMAADGYYESRWTGSAWSPRVRLPLAQDPERLEIGAVFSPSGRSLLYSRDTGPPRSGEFFLWRIEGNEAWPPACRGRRAGRLSPARSIGAGAGGATPRTGSAPRRLRHRRAGRRRSEKSKNAKVAFVGVI